MTTVVDASVHLSQLRRMLPLLTQPPRAQRLRSDAQDNRDRVLEAARELFSERGLDVPMREIARHAEVGPATLYRRFPTKLDLVDEAFSQELHACTGIVREGCADPDAWRGLRSVILRIGELNERNRGFTEAFASTFPGAMDFTAHRREMLRELGRLCRRAQDAGELRHDATVDDIIAIFTSSRSLAGKSVRARATASRRFSTIAIEGLRARPGAMPLP